MPRFSYYFFSVLCKLVKELYPYRLARNSVSRLAGAKVQLFSETTNFFKKKFQFLCKKYFKIDTNQI